MEIASECGHCGRRLELVVDSELTWRQRQTGAQPLIFEPDIDWRHFQGKTIVADYWRAVKSWLPSDDGGHSDL